MSADISSVDIYHPCCSYGQDQGYGQYSGQSGSGGGELVAKQEDGGLIDRLFFSSRIPLPIAITLFVVDLVVSAAAGTWPGTAAAVTLILMQLS